MNNNIYTYNFIKKYSFLYKNPSWAIDIRHLMILYNILMNINLKRVIEIGSHYGVSSTAFIETLKIKKNIEIHFCDTKITKTLKLISKEGMLSGNIFLHEEDSLSFLKNKIKFDFAFIDSFHISEQTIGEFELLSSIGIKNIMLHDTNTENSTNIDNALFFDGPPIIANRLKSSPQWHCIEDKIERNLENTERGLFFATQDIEIYRTAKKIFHYWSKIDYELILKD